MKQAAALLLTGVLVFGSTALGQTSVEFTVTPEVEWNFGTTKYTMDQDDVGSELEFPLDLTLAGGRFGVSWFKEGHPEWTLSGQAMFGVNDPGGVFTDKDWINTQSGARYGFSSTESHVEMNMTRLEIEATRLLAHGETAELALLVGFGYQKISLDAVDLKGSQAVVDGDSVYIVWFDIDTLALKYEIEYFVPQIGLVPRLRPHPDWLLELMAAFSPLVRVQDLDTHLLRYFTVEAEGNGFGVCSRLGLWYKSPGSPASRKPRIFAGLTGDFSYFKADLSATIEFYADNPDEGYDEGEILPDLPHDIRSAQFAVGVQAGIAF